MQNKKLFLKFIFLPLIIIEIAKFTIPATSIFETSTLFDLVTSLLLLCVTAFLVKAFVIKNFSNLLFWWGISLITWAIVDFVPMGINFSASKNPTLARYFSVIIVIFVSYVIYTAVSFLVGGLIGKVLRKENK
jgi:hypothetical protein